VSDWISHAIWWHVYPLGFTGSEREALPADEPVRHRLPQLTNWLGYLVELGCNGLLLGPVFASQTHGYDTVDHFRIDPRLGDESDFADLVIAARARGVRIVLDGVFNHVARSFPRSDWMRRASEGGYATFEGHEHLVALDHDNTEVVGYVADVMNHWLDAGVSGWRLDAAYAVDPGFWRKVLPQVREKHPDAWFLGEMIHGDYARYATDSGLDSITQYELWKAIWSSLNDANLFELAWTLRRHNEFCEGELPHTFVGNHDVTRLASRLTDERHLGHALAVLFTVAGVPGIYYGDEQAFRGIKEDRVGGDDEIRPQFPSSPDGLAAGGWPVYRLHQRLIGLRRRHPWLVHARTVTEHLTNTAGVLRSTVGEQSVVTLLNVGDEPCRFPLDLAGLSVAVAPEPGGEHGDPALVPPHSWAILA
jgi:cyclomaltodextrinase